MSQGARRKRRNEREDEKEWQEGRRQRQVKYRKGAKSVHEGQERA